MFPKRLNIKQPAKWNGNMSPVVWNIIFENNLKKKVQYIYHLEDEYVV